MKGRSTPKRFREHILTDSDGDDWIYQGSSDTWHFALNGEPAIAGFSFQRLVTKFGPLVHFDGSSATL